MQVEIFKTNINTGQEARLILTQLKQSLPGLRMNFDLDDCDRILRVEGALIEPAIVVEIIKENGYHCLKLE